MRNFWKTDDWSTWNLKDRENLKYKILISGLLLFISFQDINKKFSVLYIKFYINLYNYFVEIIIVKYLITNFDIYNVSHVKYSVKLI